MQKDFQLILRAEKEFCILKERKKDDIIPSKVVLLTFSLMLIIFFLGGFTKNLKKITYFGFSYIATSLEKKDPQVK